MEGGELHLLEMDISTAILLMGVVHFAACHLLYALWRGMGIDRHICLGGRGSLHISFTLGYRVNQGGFGDLLG